jgi:hypothetical protein
MKILTQLPQRSRPAAAFAKLPKWFETALNSCPPAGEGVHFWIFRIARNLIVHMSEADIFTLLKNKVATCGRRVPDKEILSQIRNAKACAWRPEKPELFLHGAALPADIPSRTSQRAWPEADVDAIRPIVKAGDGLYDLTERSPLRFVDGQFHAEEIIDVLFPGDPLLCVGKSNYCSATRRRETWRGHLARLPLIVPNPMLNVFGRTKIENRPSEHTLEQTARRVYLVIEFDFTEFARDGKDAISMGSLGQGMARFEDHVSGRLRCASLAPSRAFAARRCRPFGREVFARLVLCLRQDRRRAASLHGLRRKPWRRSCHLVA